LWELALQVIQQLPAEILEGELG